MGPSRSELVYGSDDRQDYFSVESERARELVARSTVAFVDRRFIEQDASGGASLAQTSYRELYGVCPGAPFEDQPAPAQCSGVLLDRDLVLTAAHCVRRIACEDWGLVFGFHYEAPEALHPLSDRDVFACADVVSMNYSRSGSATETDYAVLRLDRPVDGDRRPVPVFLADEPMRIGEPITVIGHPAGLPAKTDSGGRVADARADTLDHFRATSDAFDGSSGSGVYDTQGRLRGVLARGGEDYQSDVPGQCRELRRLPDELAVAEEKVTYLARALDGLCATRFRSAGLCGSDPDGGCSVAAPGSRGRRSAWLLVAGAALAWPRRRRSAHR